MNYETLEQDLKLKRDFLTKLIDAHKISRPASEVKEVYEWRREVIEYAEKELRSLDKVEDYFRSI